MPPPTIGGGGITILVVRQAVRCPSIRPSVLCPLIFISRNALSLYQWRPWEFQQNCHKYSSCEWALLKRFSRSGDKGSRSWPDQLTHYGGGIHFNGEASTLTCSACWQPLSFRSITACPEHQRQCERLSLPGVTPFFIRFVQILWVLGPVNLQLTSNA